MAQRLHPTPHPSVLGPPLSIRRPWHLCVHGSRQNRERRAADHPTARRTSRGVERGQPLPPSRCHSSQPQPNRRPGFRVEGRRGVARCREGGSCGSSPLGNNSTGTTFTFTPENGDTFLQDIGHTSAPLPESRRRSGGRVRPGRVWGCLGYDGQDPRSRPLTAAGFLAVRPHALYLYPHRQDARGQRSRKGARRRAFLQGGSNFPPSRRRGTPLLPLPMAPRRLP